MPERRPIIPALLVLALTALLGACSADNDKGTVTPVDIPAASMSHIVLAWSERGMHFLNSTYDAEVLSPPYNTIVAQVVRRGDPPEIVTTGITLEYRLVGNTYSYGKSTEDPVRDYAQFWDNALALFDVDLALNTGLNFVDPDVHNGLTGSMVLRGDRFVVDGVPVVPIDDEGTWNPYQVAEIVARDAASGLELARTTTAAETSDEINCAKCHGQTIGDVEIGSVLQEHDDGHETTFVDDGLPVFCAECHGSAGLGRPGAGSADKSLSYAIHIQHYAQSIGCYDCHPGAETLANRSSAHTSETGDCTACHGDLTNVASTIAYGRVPWTNEPSCVDCHTFVAEVDTGTALYRDGAGHGGLACPACHGPAHAQIPSNQEADNAQAVKYQAKALSLGSCRVCHSKSKGGGLAGVVEAHGGARPTSCVVCHTGPIRTTNPYHFPHRFQIRSR
jgi:hypothetical protein